AMRVSDISGRARSPPLHGVAPPLVEAGHQKHGGVDDSPRQVAAERAEQHGSNLDGICGYDAQRQREGKRHYQAEQNLRDPLHRLEDSLGRSGRKLRQWIDRHLDQLVLRLAVTGLRGPAPILLRPGLLALPGTYPIGYTFIKIG